MLQKLTAKPVWYRAWAITVAVAAVFVLVRYFIGPLGAIDYALATYASGSLAVDRLVLRAKAPPCPPPALPVRGRQADSGSSRILNEGEVR